MTLEEIQSSYDELTIDICQYLKDNPITSVVDFEEEEIEIMYAYACFPDREATFYLEFDSRLKYLFALLTPLDMELLCNEILFNLNYFCRFFKRGFQRGLDVYTSYGGRTTDYCAH